MLKQSSLYNLRGKKNLLAFSAGVDSTALFFLLQDENIEFDIAIVNYNRRKQSLEEVSYAKELASQNNLTCHTLDAKKITNNFEAQAREIRYDFFNSLIEKNSYENLLTAHHLGDRFEWMLMQFCKGAGCVELAAMKELEERENYTLIRPLLHLDKSELLNYLKLHTIKYFEDESNLDTSIKRNSFRLNHAKPLLQEHLNGIKKSFKYIDEDIKSISEDIEIFTIDDFAYFKSSNNKRADITMIDKYLKQQLHLASAGERTLLKTKKTVILGRKFLVNQEHEFVFIIPYINEDSVMPKEFKEECRVLQIDPKLRPYLYKNKKVFQKVRVLLN